MIRKSEKNLSNDVYICYGYFRRNWVKCHENILFNFTLQSCDVISSKYFHVKNYKIVEQHVKITAAFTFNYYLSELLKSF